MNIEETVMIKAQNVHDYFEKYGKVDGWFDADKYVSCKLPFPSLLITFDWNPSVGPAWPFGPNVSYNDGAHLGVEVMSSDAPHAIAHINQFFVDRFGEASLDYVIPYTGNETIVRMRAFYEGQETPLESMFITDKNGQIVPHRNLASWMSVTDCYPSSFTEDMKLKLEKWMFHLTCTAALTINLMNCRNVQIVDNPPSRQQRRHAERKGLPAPVSYKTLIIEPIMGRIKYSSKQNKEVETGMISPLHISRGHFKDYRNGPGLGKRHIHGIWWWSSHIRGSSEIGRVSKDYEVAVKP